MIKIKFQSLSFQPKSININDKEEDSGTIIEAIVNTTEKEHSIIKKLYIKQLKKQINYFPVELEGDIYKNLIMRLGRQLWSFNGRIYKHRIVLVEKKYDEWIGNNHELGISEINLIAINSSFINELGNLLQKKGILSDAELNNLKEKAQDNLFNERFRFCKVANIDDNVLILK